MKIEISDHLKEGNNPFRRIIETPAIVIGAIRIIINRGKWNNPDNLNDGIREMEIGEMVISAGVGGINNNSYKLYIQDSSFLASLIFD